MYRWPYIIHGFDTQISLVDAYPPPRMAHLDPLNQARAELWLCLEIFLRPEEATCDSLQPVRISERLLRKKTNNKKMQLQVLQRKPECVYAF